MRSQHRYQVVSIHLSLTKQFATNQCVAMEITVKWSVTHKLRVLLILYFAASTAFALLLASSTLTHTHLHTFLTTHRYILWPTIYASISNFGSNPLHFGWFHLFQQTTYFVSDILSIPNFDCFVCFSILGVCKFISMYFALFSLKNLSKFCILRILLYNIIIYYNRFW